jgi:hypothetical protein
MKSVPRAHWQVHSEEKNILANRHGRSKPTQQFIVAETKFKAYSLSARTFIDIVDDPSCCNSYADTAKRTSCLRIRTGARSIAPLKLFNPSASDSAAATQDSLPTDHSDPAPARTSCYLLPTDEYDANGRNPYAYAPVALWPGSKTSSASIADGCAHDVLNPIDTHSVDVQAASDDRMLVLLLRDGGCGGAATRGSGGGARFRPGGEGKLVVLSFDGEVVIPDEDVDGRRGCGEAQVALVEQRPTGSVGAGGAGMPAWAGRRVAEEDANELVDEGFRQPEKEVYAPDVYAALARAPDEYSDDAKDVDLDLGNEAWGW